MRAMIYLLVSIFTCVSFAQTTDSITITIPNTQSIVYWGYATKDYFGHNHGLYGTNKFRVPKGSSVSLEVEGRRDKKWTKIRVNGVEQPEYMGSTSDPRPQDQVVRWDTQSYYLYIKNVQTDMNVEIDEIPYDKYVVDTVYVDSVEHLRILSKYVNSAGIMADGSRYYVKGAADYFRVVVKPELGYELDTLKQYWLDGWFKGETFVRYANPYFDPGVNQIHKDQLGGLYLDFSFFAKWNSRIIPKAIKSPMPPLVFTSAYKYDLIRTDTERSFIFFDLKGNIYTNSAPMGERLYARLRDTAENPTCLQKSQCVYSLEVNGQNVAKNHLCNSDTLDLGVVNDPVFIRGTNSLIWDYFGLREIYSNMARIANVSLRDQVRFRTPKLQFYQNGLIARKDTIILYQDDSTRLRDSVLFSDYAPLDSGRIFKTTHVGDVWTWKATMEVDPNDPTWGQSGNFVSMIEANCFDTTTSSMEYKPQKFSATFYQQDSLKDMGNYWLYQNQYLFESARHCGTLDIVVYSLDEIIKYPNLSSDKLIPITEKNKQVANLSPSFEFIKTPTGFWIHGNQTGANAHWFDGKGQTIGQNHIEVGSSFVKAPSYRGPMYLIITGAHKNPQAIRWQ